MQGETSGTVSTTMDGEARARLRAIAKAEHRTVANLVSKVLTEWLETQPPQAARSNSIDRHKQAARA